MALTAPAPFARAGAPVICLRCHLGNEGYEYVNHPHENEGRACRGSLNCKLATTLKQTETTRLSVKSQWTSLVCTLAGEWGAGGHLMLCPGPNT